MPAIVPAPMLPNGAMPKKATVKKLITLPRLSSSRIVWRIVLQDATRVMAPNPATTKDTKERLILLEMAKDSNPDSKQDCGKDDQLAKPSTLLRDARYMVPTKAPHPTAVMRKPKV